jgi:hypothetical protein
MALDSDSADFNDSADFVVLTPAGPALYGRRGPSETINAVIRRYARDLTT